MEIMEIKNLYYSYPKSSELFSGYNFQFNAGEIVLLKGPSGKGKSTLAAIMAGHLLPHRGEINLDGKTVTGPNRHIIVVHQENDLFPWLSVHENLKLLQKIHLHDKGKSDFRSELKEFGLLEAIDSYPAKISGGMKRRLAILRGLLMGPKVLILDESLSSLDEKLKQQIMTVLKSAIDAKKMILIIIDHNADSIAHFIDRTIELKDNEKLFNQKLT